MVVWQSNFLSESKIICHGWNVGQTTSAISCRACSVFLDFLYLYNTNPLIQTEMLPVYYGTQETCKIENSVIKIIQYNLDLE